MSRMEDSEAVAGDEYLQVGYLTVEEQKHLAELEAMQDDESMSGYISFGSDTSESTYMFMEECIDPFEERRQELDPGLDSYQEVHPADPLSPFDTDQATDKEEETYLLVETLQHHFEEFAQLDGGYLHVQSLSNIQVHTLRSLIPNELPSQGSAAAFLHNIQEMLQGTDGTVSGMPLKQLVRIGGKQNFQAWLNTPATEPLTPLEETIVKQLQVSLDQHAQRSLSFERVSEGVLERLEEVYKANVTNPILRRGCFSELNSLGHFQPARKSKPAFQKFSKLCDSLLQNTSKAMRELLQRGGKTQGRIFYYLAARTTQALQVIVEQLGAASTMELCSDGFDISLLGKIASMIWVCGRQFRCTTTNQATSPSIIRANMLAWLHRLAFVLNRILQAE
eukprot:m.140278 g.140278  ORF g.140278 m.140278 type:complete len:393 (-) comp14031_c1_seq1:1341-2519(-)